MGNNFNEKDIKESSTDEKSKEKQINAIIGELNNLINDMKNSKQLSGAIAESQAPSTAQGDQSVGVTIIQTAATLAAINSIKTELCRLPLNFCEREYIANCVTPLGTVMELVSRTSFDLATSISILTNSVIVPRKKGKIKDTINTIYDMNDEVEDLYKVLKGRLKKLKCEEFSCSFLEAGCDSESENSLSGE